MKDGDTIYDIARRALAAQNSPVNAASIKQEISQIIQSNADAYPRLANNPDLIHAGDRLQLGSDTNTVCPATTPLELQPSQQIRQTPNTDQPTGYDQQPSDFPNTYRPRNAVNQSYSIDGDYRDYNYDSRNSAGQSPDYRGSGRTYDRYNDPNAYIVDRSDYGAGLNQNDPRDWAPTRRDYGYDVNNQPGSDLSFTGQEALRLSQMMINSPHEAASELRDQIQRLDPQSAGELIAKTKNDECVGGLGDLQIQVEFDQYGRDTGFRNVTMATPDGIEQIAEIQSRPQPVAYGNDMNPLSFIAGVIVGDLLWQQRRGLDFNDDRYRGWCNREQERENCWNRDNGQFVQNWQNQEYRNRYQSQNWQQAAQHPNINNTYITNNRYDTTINNRTVNNTVINETINNTQNINAVRRPVHISEPVHRVPGLTPTSPIVQHKPDTQIKGVLPAQTFPISQYPQGTGQYRSGDNGLHRGLTPGAQLPYSQGNERIVQGQHLQQPQTTFRLPSTDLHPRETIQPVAPSTTYRQEAPRDQHIQSHRQDDGTQLQAAQQQRQQEEARLRAAQLQHQHDEALRAAQLQHQQEVAHQQDVARQQDAARRQAAQLLLEQQAREKAAHPGAKV